MRFSAFYETWKFSGTQHTGSLSWARLVQSTPIHLISFGSLFYSFVPSVSRSFYWFVFFRISAKTLYVLLSYTTRLSYPPWFDRHDEVKIKLIINYYWWCCLSVFLQPYRLTLTVFILISSLPFFLKEENHANEINVLCVCVFQFSPMNHLTKFHEIYY
jgi:hypothetical protein